MGTALQNSAIPTQLFSLTEARYPDNTWSYQYDPTGNRTVYTDTGNVLTYTYDAADRMTAVGGRSVTWDNNGNLLTKDGVTYAYDSANRLTSVVSGTLVATYEYNDQGLRTSMTINGARTNYLWDVNASLPVILTDTSSIYVYGLGRIARQTGNDVEYYHSDALGSIRNLTNGSGQNVGAYSYMPFGDQMLTGGTSSNRFQYTGQLNDQETGQYYLRARYYLPYLSRFIQADTVVPDWRRPQSLNRYSYVGNNPTGYADPTGHCLWDACVIEGATAPLWGPVVVGGGLILLAGAAAAGDWVGDQIADAINGKRKATQQSCPDPIVPKVDVTPDRIRPGMKVYRVWGLNGFEFSPYWTDRDPRTAPNPPGYRSLAGLPSTNDGHWLTEGTLASVVGVEFHPFAPPFPGEEWWQEGGWPEVWIPDPEHQVIDRTKHWIDDPDAMWGAVRLK